MRELWGIFGAGRYIRHWLGRFFVKKGGNFSSSFSFQIASQLKIAKSLFVGIGIT